MAKETDTSSSAEGVEIIRDDVRAAREVPGYSAKPMPNTCQHEEQVEIGPGEFATMYCTSKLKKRTVVVNECENNHEQEVE